MNQVIYSNYSTTIFLRNSSIKCFIRFHGWRRPSSFSEHLETLEHTEFARAEYVRDFGSERVTSVWSKNVSKKLATIHEAMTRIEECAEIRYNGTHKICCTRRVWLRTNCRSGERAWRHFSCNVTFTRVLFVVPAKFLVVLFEKQSQQCYAKNRPMTVNFVNIICCFFARLKQSGRNI